MESQLDILQPKKIKLISIKKKKERKKLRENKLIKILDKRIKPYSKTISIAVPASILSNSQSKILKTYLIGQIARSATIFNIDEIVIFEDRHAKFASLSMDCIEMAHVLQYLECPQYLRKSLFPHHPNLQFVGLLNPLDCPHHIRKDAICEYREGVIVKQNCNKNFEGVDIDDEETIPKSSVANIGLDKLIHLDQKLPINTRITVHIDNFSKLSAPTYNIGSQNFKNNFSSSTDPNDNSGVKMNGRVKDGIVSFIENDANKDSNIKIPKKFKGTIVSPLEAKQTLNKFWGYNVRIAHKFHQIFEPDKYKYDLIVGTSDKGDSLQNLTSSPDFQEKLNSCKHPLIVFGGLKGLEYAFEQDPTFKQKSINARNFFDFYINTCPKQGSGTIRTEEAIMISLTVLTPLLQT